MQAVGAFQRDIFKCMMQDRITAAMGRQSVWIYWADEDDQVSRVDSGYVCREGALRPVFVRGLD